MKASRLSVGWVVGMMMWGSGSLEAQTLQFDPEPVLEIGVLDGPVGEVFGRIADVYAGGDGSYFIVDRQAAQVRWFGPDGELRGSTGRLGDGPGEFRAPDVLSVGPDGHVYVLDIGNFRVSEFRIHDDELELLATWQAPLGSRGLCRVGDRFFVLAQASGPDGGVVHEFDRGGTLVRTFAEPPSLRPEQFDASLERYRSVMESMTTSGTLACDDEQIVVTHQRLPLVRSFTIDGSPLWEVELEDFHPVRWAPHRSGGFVMGTNPQSGTAHTNLGLAIAPDGYVAVTLHEGGPDLPIGGVLQLRVLRKSDGRELERRDVSFRVRAVTEEHIVGDTEAPWPMVRVYRRASP